MIEFPVLAVDPGKTTGVAHLASTDGTPHTWQLQGHLHTCCWFAECISGHAGPPPALVVCESFIINATTHKKSPQPYSMELIGVLRYLCEYHEVPFKLQTPADAKRFSTDDKLKRLGWWVPGQDHADDALRHLLLALVNARWDGVERLVD